MTRHDLHLRAVTAAATLGLLASSALAHDDDPKILDRKAPVPGSGYVRGLPAGAPLPGGGTNPGSANDGPFNSSGVILQSWLTLGDLGVAGASGNDCWGYVSPSGREYALMGTTTNTVIVEVTNPTVPVIVDSIDGPNSTWRDMKVYQDHMYIVSEGGGGIQVVDLSQIDSGTVTELASVTSGGNSSTHNVAIDEDSGFLYRCGGGNNVGLRIYDLSNPSQPTFVGQWLDRYVHDAQIVTFTSGPLAGREIAYCCSGFNNGGTDTGLTILDVTDKSNITVLSQIAYPGRAYSHQGWLSGDRQWFYLGDELDENGSFGTRTFIFDVSDPSNAIYSGSFDLGPTAIGHNMYEKDGRMYQANYTSGLRVLDISQPTAPVEIAYFDTSSSSSASFNGLWSCFPDFPSGIVIGSDIEGGLFVWNVDTAVIDIDVVGGAPSQLLPTGDNVNVTISEGTPGDLVAGSELLWIDDGSGFSATPLTNNGGGNYTANFPALMCPSDARWYISAETPMGSLITEPSGGANSPFISTVAAALTVTRDDDMETPAGWVGGQPGDTATTGQWTRDDPNGTSAQPEDDHTPSGTQCWFTGQANPGQGVGSNDVDGGYTTLLSEALDASGLANPQVSYWRWYSNDQGGSANSDVFQVDISGDNGATWVPLETVGPTGPETSGGWIQATFDVAAFVTPTNQVRLRFIAEDAGSGSIVEAAIDDLRVFDIDCGTGIGFSYCMGVPNSTGAISEITGMGSNVLANNDLVLTGNDLPANANGYFVTAPVSAFVTNPGGSAGNLCVGAPTGRYIAQLGNSGTSGMISLAVDNTAIPQPTGDVAASVGDTWYFQLWYRDAVLGFPTSNFSRGFAVTFQ